MNFLQLCQATKRESGLSGSFSFASTSTSEDARIQNWVNWAGRDITLARESWRWRRGAATVASTTLQTNTAADFGLTDFSSWKRAAGQYKPSAYRIADGAGSEHDLLWVDYDQFAKMFMRGAQTPSSAQYWTISPNDGFLIGPTPDSAHFLRADYIKGYTDLALEADTPSIPADFHMAIVWKALMEYGGFDAANEVYMRAEKNYTALWTALVQSQLEAPSMMARSLA